MVKFIKTLIKYYKCRSKMEWLFEQVIWLNCATLRATSGWICVVGGMKQFTLLTRWAKAFGYAMQLQQHQQQNNKSARTKSRLSPTSLKLLKVYIHFSNIYLAKVSSFTLGGILFFIIICMFHVCMLTNRNITAETKFLNQVFLF